MGVLTLARELRASGWNCSGKMAILAARFYLGLETEESLHVSSGLSVWDVAVILERR